MSKRLATIRFTATEAAGPDPIQRLNVPASLKGEPLEIFQQHTYLEPGESYIEDLALKVSDEIPFMQARLELLGDRPDRTWLVIRVIPVR